eukprot:2541264-Rhodomonas_salina.1
MPAQPDSIDSTAPWEGGVEGVARRAEGDERQAAPTPLAPCAQAPHVPFRVGAHAVGCGGHRGEASQAAAACRELRPKKRHSQHPLCLSACALATRSPLSADHASAALVKRASLFCVLVVAVVVVCARASMCVRDSSCYELRM